MDAEESGKRTPTLCNRIEAKPKKTIHPFRHTKRRCRELCWWNVGEVKQNEKHKIEKSNSRRNTRISRCWCVRCAGGISRLGNAPQKSCYRYTGIWYVEPTARHLVGRYKFDALLAGQFDIRTRLHRHYATSSFVEGQKEIYGSRWSFWYWRCDTVRTARFRNGTAPLECGGTSEDDNGNGSLMRILPMAFYLHKTQPESLRDFFWHHS